MPTGWWVHLIICVVETTLGFVLLYKGKSGSRLFLSFLGLVFLLLGGTGLGVVIAVYLTHA